MHLNKYFGYHVIAFFCISLLCSCVSYKAQYSGDWQRNDATDDAYYTVYLIGDGGNVAIGQSSEVLDHLKAALDKEDSRSAIIWLGDNIYPVGLAPLGSVYHADGRHRLLAQLNTMTDFKGEKYFVPGNHDWYAYGRIGLRRQELLVDSFLVNTPNPNNQLNYFIPDKGCGDPQILPLADSLGLLLMDSHWFLNEKARTGDQSVCAVETPKEFMDKLASEIDSYRNKSLIVASHHPPYTYAHHGGKFPFKDDFFAFTQIIDWLYLPTPLIGYIFNRSRLRLSEQDVYHPRYVEYRGGLIRYLEKKGRSIVVSGHEHTLQHIENEDQYFVVSGAGSKKNKVGKGKGTEFAIGQKGYVKLIFRNYKEAVVQYIVPGQFENHSNIAYEKLIYLE